MPSGRPAIGCATNWGERLARSPHVGLSTAAAELLALRRANAAWLEALPDALRDMPTAEALQTIVDLDLEALASIELPRGYGRD